MKTIIAACTKSGFLTGFGEHIPWINLPEWHEFLKNSAQSSNLPVVISGTPEEDRIYSQMFSNSGILPHNLLPEDLVTVIGSNSCIFQEVLPSTTHVFLARLDYNLRDGRRFPESLTEFRRVSYYGERLELELFLNPHCEFKRKHKTVIVPVTFEHWIRKI